VPWDKAQFVPVFMEAYKVSYLVGRDAAGTITTLYDVDRTPINVFIDKAGRLVELHVGGLEEEEFVKRLAPLLK
jgi:hypothetical protein